MPHPGNVTSATCSASQAPTTYRAPVRKTLRRRASRKSRMTACTMRFRSRGLADTLSARRPTEASGRAAAAGARSDRRTEPAFCPKLLDDRGGRLLGARPGRVHVDLGVLRHLVR